MAETIRLTVQEQNQQVPMSVEQARIIEAISPEASVERVEGGAELTVTDYRGTTSVVINDGEPGEPGDPGQPGVSPTVTVTDITGGHRVTVTDATGEHSFDVMDGEPGDPGDPAELIDDTSTTAENRTWSAKKLNNKISDLPETKNSTATGVDLDVSDANGNVLVRFANGNIETKNFKSKNNSSLANSDATGVDFDIADQNGNVLARFADGGIETKEFNSETANERLDDLEAAVFPESVTSATVNNAADLLDEIANGETDIIYLENGTYNVLNVEVNRNVQIIGKSRTRVIINADGSTSQEAITDRHGIRFNYGGALKNLTFNANNVKYIAHQDNIAREYNLLFEDCTFNRYDDSCGYYFFIGCGCYGKQNLSFKNCSFIFSNNTNNRDSSGVYWHNWYLAKSQLNAFSANLTLENCGFVGCRAVYAQDISDKTANDFMNVLSCTSTESAPVVSGANGYYINVTNDNVPYNIVFNINSKIGDMKLVDRSADNYVYLQSAVTAFV